MLKVYGIVFFSFNHPPGTLSLKLTIMDGALNLNASITRICESYVNLYSWLT